MVTDSDWRAPVLTTRRLTLEPLRVEHADEMAAVLADPALHTYTGGHPASPEQLRGLYVHQVRGRSADGSERWLNWVIRHGAGGRALGYVQATITWPHGVPTAEVAWVVGTAHQGQGYAREAAAAMAHWLRERGAEVVVAHVHPDHVASQRVAAALALVATGVVVDGEVRWEG